MTTTTKNNGLFAGIVGQEIAKLSIGETVTSSLNGGDLPRIFLDAPAGTGKTAIMDRLATAYHEAGYFIHRVDLQAVKLLGDDYRELVTSIADPTRGGLYEGTIFLVDEIHQIKTLKTVQIAKFTDYLMKFLDGNNSGRVMQYDSDTSFHVDRSKVGIVCGTNLKSYLPEALLSRMSIVPLVNYSTEELIDILQLMLGKRGLRHADEKTLKIIAETGRGTARPMEKIAEKLSEISRNQGKATVNRDDVLNAMRQTRIFPKGCTVDEIKLLSMASNLTPANVLLTKSCMDKKSFDAAKNYLISIGYLGVHPRGLSITSSAVKYLDQISKAKFDLSF